MVPKRLLIRRLAITPFRDLSQRIRRRLSARQPDSCRPATYQTGIRPTRLRYRQRRPRK